jgi:membrane protease YdiL (CAAX protease family)
MLRAISIICGVILVPYMAAQGMLAFFEYRHTQRAIAEGDTSALTNLYKLAMWVNWGSAVLALAALQFDISRLTPGHLHIGDAAFCKWCSLAWRHVETGFPAVITNRGSLLLVALFLRIWFVRHRTAQVAQYDQKKPLTHLVPVNYFVPLTAHERVVYTLFALSVAICEEVVFRGWLMDALHGVVGLTGAALILTAALLFGLCHYAAGYLGILLTGLIGLVLCGVYVATGSLLVPIILHFLIDARFSLFPRTRFMSEENV